MTPFEQAQMLLYGKVYHFDTPLPVPPPLFAVMTTERRQFAREHSKGSRNQRATLYAWQLYNPLAKKPERN